MTSQLPLPITAPFSKAQRAAVFNLIARAARAEILPRFGRLDADQIGTKAGPNDFVTEADLAAEAMIQRGLQIAFPHAEIIGEELAETDPEFRKALKGAELGFVIDPIDGTWNFANGMALFGTMLAVTRFGRAVFGAIYDPIAQEFFWTQTNGAALRQGKSRTPQPLATRKKQNLRDMTGFIEFSSMTAEHHTAAAQACTALAYTSSLRCSAHHYRLLAQGAVDFFLASKLNPWDHLAGVLICQQAGGYAAMLDGSAYDSSTKTGYLLSAGSKESWDQLAAHFSALNRSP
jgi:fructose-1,6-bisphosphatase/inositol monophosphatase family enzyme